MLILLPTFGNRLGSGRETPPWGGLLDCFERRLNGAESGHDKRLLILLSHKKEQNSAICRDVDGSRDCYTELNESEREKQIPYVNTYIQNLERWY